MLNKVQKEEIVSNYKDSFSTTPSFLLINFKGARVSEFEKLRNKLRDILKGMDIDSNIKTIYSKKLPKTLN